MPRKNKTKRISRPKGRKTLGPKRPKTRLPMMVGKASGLVRAICTITDPFCNSALGSKYPDTGSTRTLAWTVDTWATVTTDAYGRGAIFLGSDPENFSSAATGFLATTGAQINLSSVPITAPNYNTFILPGTATEWRLVSKGLQVRSIMSMMNNQGSIGIIAIPFSPGSISFGGSSPIDLDATNYADNQRISANSGKELSAIAFQDGVTSKIFQQSVISSLGTSQVSSGGTEVLVAYITGGPASTAAIQVRMVAHYELAFAAGTLYNQLATPMAVDNPIAQKGQSFVQRILGRVTIGGTAEVERKVMGAAENFARNLVRGAGAMLGNAIGGPILGYAGSSAAGMIMDID
jgi:hypothetical protein